MPAEKRAKILALVKELSESQVRTAELQAQLNAELCDGQLTARESAASKVLAFLVHHSPKIVTPSIVVRELGITQNNVMVSLHRLCERGVVIRESHGCYRAVRQG